MGRLKRGGCNHLRRVQDLNRGVGTCSHVALPGSFTAVGKRIRSLCFSLMVRDCGEVISCEQVVLMQGVWSYATGMGWSHRACPSSEVDPQEEDAVDECDGDLSPWHMCCVRENSGIHRAPGSDLASVPPEHNWQAGGRSAVVLPDDTVPGPRRRSRIVAIG